MTLKEKIQALLKNGIQVRMLEDKDKSGGQLVTYIKSISDFHNKQEERYAAQVSTYLWYEPQLKDITDIDRVVKVKLLLEKIIKEWKSGINKIDKEYKESLGVSHDDKSLINN